MGRNCCTVPKEIPRIIRRDMSETFPRKPLLDRIIVREIPLSEYWDKSTFKLPGKGEFGESKFNVRSDRGIVVAVGDCVPMGGVILPMPVKVGDTVFFDDLAFDADPVYLNPADKHRSDLPKYGQMRVGDLKGVQVDA
jgi:co-chaperonin GroES (HSP10)